MAQRKSKKVTERQARVVQALTVSENISSREKVEAALGYRSSKTNSELVTPEVARAVKAGLVRRLVAEAAPRSLGLLMRVVEKGHKAMDAGGSATQLQVDAAKHLTNLAGLQAVAEEKDYADMSDTEFRQVLEQVHMERGRRTAVDAEVVDSAPSDAPVDTQDTDKVDSLFS